MPQTDNVTEGNRALTSERVEAIFLDCLRRETEAAGVIAEGIAHTVAFNEQRLEEHRDEVLAMLNELPDEYKQSGGGGWSFLNACNDRDGHQWTGLHLRMEQLFQLGIGLGVVESLLSRDMWSALPGGVPYYVIKDSA